MTDLEALHTPEPGTLLAAYLDHVETLGLGGSAIEQRRHHACALLDAHGNLVAWMGRPLRDRLVDLKRTKSWPFVVWAVLTGRVAPDVDLLVARHLGGMHRLAGAMFADGFAEVRTAARLERTLGRPCAGRPAHGGGCMDRSESRPAHQRRS